VKLFDQELDDGRDYYLCRRTDVELPDGAQRLATWLLDTIRPPAPLQRHRLRS